MSEAGGAVEAAAEAFREACAAAVERHDMAGREWVPGSLWDTLSREAAARIRAVPIGDLVSAARALPLTSKD